MARSTFRILDGLAVTGGNVDVTNTLSANDLSGDGSALTNVDAATLGGVAITNLASNNFVKSIFTSNNYVDGRFAANAYLTSTFSSNAYITAHVASEVAGLVDAAPAALDTLNELAAALGDDANFSTTITTSIGLRATNTYVNSTFSSNNYLQDQLSALGTGNVSNNYLIATYASNNYVQTQLGTKLNSSSYTASDVLSKLLTVDGSGSNLDADLLDGQQGSYYLDWTNTTNKPDPVITLGGDLSGSVTLTNLASGTLTATIQPNSVALGTDTTGNYVATISGTTNEVEVSGSGSEGAGVTVGLPSNVTIGNDLTVTNDIIQTNHSFVSSTITTTSTSQTNLDTFSTSTYSGAEVNVTAISNGERHMTKILVVHDGTTAYATEYGSIFTNTSLASYDVDVSSGSVRLRVTPASATSTVFNTSMMLIEN